MRIHRLIYLFLPSLCVGQSYISEPTLKLMSAEFFGLRFPASASSNRISLDGGVDVRVPDLGDLEIANDLPTDQLVLHPGGRVVYDLPMTDKNGKVETDFVFVMVKPGKKDPPPLMNNPFTTKLISLSKLLQVVVEILFQLHALLTLWTFLLMLLIIVFSQLNLL